MAKRYLSDETRELIEVLRNCFYDDHTTPCDPMTMEKHNEIFHMSHDQLIRYALNIAITQHDKQVAAKLREETPDLAERQEQLNCIKEQINLTSRVLPPERKRK